MSGLKAPFIYHHGRNKADDQVYLMTFPSPHPSGYTPVFCLSARYHKPADVVYPAVFFLLQLRSCCVLLCGAENPAIDSWFAVKQTCLRSPIDPRSILEHHGTLAWPPIPQGSFVVEDLPSPIVASHWWAVFPNGHDVSTMDKAASREDAPISKT